MATVQIFFGQNMNRQALLREARAQSQLRNRRRQGMARNARIEARRCPAYMGLSIDHNNNYYQLEVLGCHNVPGAGNSMSDPISVPSLSNPQNLDGGQVNVHIVGTRLSKIVHLTLTENTSGTTHSVTAHNIFFENRSYNNMNVAQGHYGGSLDMQFGATP